MAAAPPLIEAGIAALLAVSIVRAFFGPPPPVADRVVAAAWVGAVAMLLVAVMLSGGFERHEVLIALAVEAICLVAWRLRRSDDEGPPHPELAGPDPNDSGIDWDEFDRLRAGWHPRTPA